MAETPTPWAIVVAGGTGARFGQLKQLAELGGRRVIDWSIAAVRPHVQGVIVVLPADLLSTASSGNEFCLDADEVVAGGATRSESVRAGLDAVPNGVKHVLIHDAARPLAPTDLVERVVAGLFDADAVVPVVPITDTLRRRGGSAVDRSEFVAVQTPQGFVLASLLSAHGSGAEATDDASLIDAIGGTVAQVKGDPANLKITVSTDLGMAEVLLAGLNEAST